MKRLTWCLCLLSLNPALDLEGLWLFLMGMGTGGQMWPRNMLHSTPDTVRLVSPTTFPRDSMTPARRPKRGFFACDATNRPRNTSGTTEATTLGHG